MNEETEKLSGFAEKLSYLLRVKPLSQKHLSSITSLSQSTISEMARGKRRPYLDQAHQLAKAFEVPLEYFADDEFILESDVDKTVNEKLILNYIRAIDLPLDKALKRLAGPVFLNIGDQIINRNAIEMVRRIGRKPLEIEVRLKGYHDSIFAHGDDAEILLYELNYIAGIRITKNERSEGHGGFENLLGP